MPNKALKRLLFAVCSLLTLLIALFFLITTNQHNQPKSIKNSDILHSQQIISDIVTQLNSNNGRIELVFQQPELDALTSLASYTLPQASFAGSITPFGLVLSAQMPVPLAGRSVRMACLLLNESSRFAISQCQFGQLPIPASMANYILQKVVKKMVSAPTSAQLLDLFAKGRLRNNSLVFIDEAASPIKLSLQSIQFPAHPLQQTDIVLAPNVICHLKQLQQLQLYYPQEQRLAFFMLTLFKSATECDIGSTITEQYNNAIWALIVAFGNNKFIHFVNTEVTHQQVPQFRPVILNNRLDLAQHFLYSAAFKLLSSSNISLKVGNVKEILDTRKGSSGFSFIDLAANSAGIALASQLSALAPSVLEQYDTESFELAVMPSIANLPEGLSEQQLQQQLGGYNGEGFKQLEQLISSRIQLLTLYSNNGNNTEK